MSAASAVALPLEPEGQRQHLVHAFDEVQLKLLLRRLWHVVKIVLTPFGGAEALRAPPSLERAAASLFMSVAGR